MHPSLTTGTCVPSSSPPTVSSSTAGRAAAACLDGADVSVDHRFALTGTVSVAVGDASVSALRRLPPELQAYLRPVALVRPVRLRYNPVERVIKAEAVLYMRGI